MKITDVKDSDLLAAYITLRDRRAQRKAEYENNDEDDKAKQERIEVEMLRRFNERGTDSISANGVGTAYRSTKTTVSIADKQAFFNDWVIPNQMWEFLDLKANKSSVSEFKAANDDLPPGLNWREEVTVNFRRK